MNEFDCFGIIAEIIISIVPSLVIGYVTNRKTQEESVFFSYITLREEKFVMHTKRKSNILMLLFVCLHLVFVFDNTIYKLPISDSVVEIAKNIGLVALFILMLGQCLCNYVLAFLDIGYLNKKLEKQNRALSDLDEMLNYIIIAIYVTYFLVLVICKSNKDIILLSSYAMVLTIIGIEAVYNSFISLYVKLRRWYYVSEINIRTKTNNNVYKKVFNYKKKGEVLTLVLEQEKIIKKFSIPINDVEVIEKIIDAENTLLNTMRKEEENDVKDKRKDNVKLQFWKEFFRQNRAITLTGIVAVFYCIVCVLLKSNERINVSEMLYPWGEFLFNMAISVIAAVIFYIVQVFIPERENKRKCMEVLKSKFVDLTMFVDMVVLLCEKYIKIKDKGVEVLWDCKDEEKIYFKLLKGNGSKTSELKSYTKTEIFNMSKDFYEKINNIKNNSLINYCDYELLEKISQLEQCNFFETLTNAIRYANTEINFNGLNENLKILKMLNEEIKNICVISSEYELENLNDLEKRYADLPRRNMIQELTSIEEFNKNNIKAIIKSQLEEQLGKNIKVEDDVLEQLYSQIYNSLNKENTKI